MWSERPGDRGQEVDHRRGPGERGRGPETRAGNQESRERSPMALGLGDRFDVESRQGEAPGPVPVLWVAVQTVVPFSTVAEARRGFREEDEEPKQTEVEMPVRAVGGAVQASRDLGAAGAPSTARAPVGDGDGSAGRKSDEPTGR